ncbi:hypothetical protein [Bradyrhizobium zhanjiangense]|uniref:hypothetical protein n=1 Tax=Bradyrhizobium zhanjiangense TaxID=1325107 RepID=UPI001FE21697|nr:hypothetical protein [Bradyrhizobium zhanjiangense]
MISPIAAAMPGGNRQIDAGDRQQFVDREIVDGDLRDLALEQSQVFRQPVKLTDVPIDGRASSSAAVG